MTGIERLRKLSEDLIPYRLWNVLDAGTEEDWDCCCGDCRTVSDVLGAIADQIEREMKTSSEVEKTKCDPDDVSMSAYDLLPADEREAIAWVREHGGLDEVRRRWKFLSHYADPVPRSCMERRLARLQRQIDESHAALRRRNQRIALLAIEINRAHNENRMEFMRRAGNYTAFADEVCKRLAPQLRYVDGCTKDVMDAALEALDSRLMPEGCEWPRYESGEPVLVGSVAEFGSDDSMTVMGVELTDGGFVLHGRNGGIERPCQVGYKLGERVKRPAVIAADGEPLEVGQTVWDMDAESDTPLTVVEVSSDLIWCEYTWKDGKTYRPCYPPSDLTHQRPVMDADGVPICVEDTVYLLPGEWCDKWPCLGFHGGEELVVTDLHPNHQSGGIRCERTKHYAACYPQPSQLTHTKPEPLDSWERVEEDAGKSACTYFCHSDVTQPPNCGHDVRSCRVDMTKDLVRRCRALAERDRGE